MSPCAVHCMKACGHANSVFGAIWPAAARVLQRQCACASAPVNRILPHHPFRQQQPVMRRAAVRGGDDPAARNVPHHGAGLAWAARAGLAHA